MRQKLKSPIALKDILPEAIHFKANNEASSLSEVDQQWSEIVGPTLARKSKPFRIYKKRLVIQVNGHCWANDLNLQCVNILNEIKKRFPYLSLEDIRFYITMHS